MPRFYEDFWQISKETFSRMPKARAIHWVWSSTRDLLFYQTVLGCSFESFNLSAARCAAQHRSALCLPCAANSFYAPNGRGKRSHISAQHPFKYWMSARGVVALVLLDVHATSSSSSWWCTYNRLRSANVHNIIASKGLNKNNIKRQKANIVLETIKHR